MPNMNKSIILLACGIFAAMCISCEEIGHTDPIHDPTKLWPAVDDVTAKWGYINDKGKMVIPAQFDEAAGFSCGYARVEKDYNIHYINTKGKIKYTGDSDDSAFEFNYFRDFRYDYVLMLHGFRHTYAGYKPTYGLMDRNFDFVIQPGSYDISEMCENGYVIFKQNGRLGYVTKKGVVIPPKFWYATPFRDGYAYIEYYPDKGNMIRGIIDETGNFVLQYNNNIIYDPLKHLGSGLFQFTDYHEKEHDGIIEGDYVFGVINVHGDTIRKATKQAYYQPAVDNGLIAVKEDDPTTSDRHCWYMDYQGNVAIDFGNQCYSATPFYEGYAWIKRNSNVQLIDTRGNVVLSYLNKGYEDTWVYPETGFHNGLALIRRHENDTTKIMYINPQGEIIYSWIVCIDKTPSNNTDDDEDYESPAISADTMSEMDEFTEQTLHFSSTRFKRNLRRLHK